MRILIEGTGQTHEKKMDGLPEVKRKVAKIHSLSGFDVCYALLLVLKPLHGILPAAVCCSAVASKHSKYNRIFPYATATFLSIIEIFPSITAIFLSANATFLSLIATLPSKMTICQ